MRFSQNFLIFSLLKNIYFNKIIAVNLFGNRFGYNLFH